jgi:hypothetical protein
MPQAACSFQFFLCMDVVYLWLKIVSATVTASGITECAECCRACQDEITTLLEVAITAGEDSLASLQKVVHSAPFSRGYS